MKKYLIECLKESMSEGLTFDHIVEKMNSNILIKLKKILDRNYFGDWIDWGDLCIRNDIRQFEDNEYDWDITGNVFEEVVVVPNPASRNGYGWLEMSKETALKILAFDHLS